MEKAKYINISTIVVLFCLFVLTVSTAMAQDNQEAIKDENSIKVKLVVHGVEREVETPVLSVRDFLSVQGVLTTGSDEVSLPSHYILRSNETISVYDVEEREEMEAESIPYTVKTVEDSSLVAGTKKVVSEGVNGEAKVTYSVVYRDGKAYSKNEIKREVVKESTPKVVHVGTKRTINGQTYVNSFTVNAVAYNLSGNTALGIPVGQGIIAVDPSVIPLGTKVYVEGYGFAIAADVGGAIKGKKVDLWMPTYGACAQWGSRNVTIYILG